MLEGEETAYAVVEIHADSMKINGYGREESRTLAVRERFLARPAAEGAAEASEAALLQEYQVIMRDTIAHGQADGLLRSSPSRLRP